MTYNRFSGILNNTQAQIEIWKIPTTGNAAYWPGGGDWSAQRGRCICLWLTCLLIFFLLAVALAARRGAVFVGKDWNEPSAASEPTEMSK